jgi:DNA-binding HxlR family transcriptional regulator
MARGYGQYCPLALAAEVLGQRWMILVISRLIDGCTSFGAIHRGVPRISPSLLSKRLAELETLGLVTKTPATGGSGPTYALTPAAQGLASIIDGMAVWGQHWARDMTTEDLDPAFLAWSMHTRLAVDRMPAARTVLEFVFTGTPSELRQFWLVCENAEVEMCLTYPGFEPDLTVHADIRRFVEAWRGFRDLRAEIRSGRIRLEGPPALRRAFPDWLLLSSLAPYERRRSGKERRLATTVTRRS